MTNAISDLFPDGWKQATRYPDPAITALDPRFEKYWLKLACVERLATGCRWAEGPVWFGDGRYLLWSDIPNNRILKWDEETGAVSVYRKPSDFANGNTRDRQGRLVDLRARRPPHHAHRIRRHHHRADGQLRRQAPQLAQRRGGEVRRFDLVHRSAVRLLGGYYEGYHGRAGARPEHLPLRSRRPAAARSSPTTCSAPTACASRPTRPSSTSSKSRASPTRKLKVFDVVKNGTASTNGRVFIDCGPGAAGRHALRYRRQPLVRLGHGQAGPRRRHGVRARRHADRADRTARAMRQPLLRRQQRNRLFMAASQSLYAVYVHAQGVPGS